VAATLTILGLLHVAWAFRRAGPGAAVLPERNGVPVLRPSPLATLAVAGLLFAAAAIVLLRVDVLQLGHSPAVVQLATWGIACTFLARAIGDFRYVGFFKSVRDTRFALLDSRYYSPLSALLGLAIVVIARGGA